MPKLPKRLILDTATDFLFVALYEGETRINYVYRQGYNNHSETLMPVVKTLFAEAAWSPRDLNEVIVGIGPGSYTGVRIGVVIAKILGFSLPITVYQVSSLALLASGTGSGPVTAFIDARRGMAFVGVYEIKAGKLIGLEPDCYRAKPLLETESGPMIEQALPDLSKLFGTPLIDAVPDIHRLEPVYLRQTEAETQRLQKARKGV